MAAAAGLRTFTMHPAVPADQGGDRPAGEPGMGVHGGLEETSPERVIGDATGATAEHGARRAAAMVGHLGEAFAEVARFDPAPRP